MWPQSWSGLFSNFRNPKKLVKSCVSEQSAGTLTHSGRSGHKHTSQLIYRNITEYFFQLADLILVQKITKIQFSKNLTPTHLDPL